MLELVLKATEVGLKDVIHWATKNNNRIWFPNGSQYYYKQARSLVVFEESKEKY